MPHPKTPRPTAAVREARLGETMNVEAVEVEYVPGPDEYLR